MQQGKFLLFAVLILFSVSTVAQVREPKKPDYESEMNIGIGLGLDYGGIVGLKVNYLPDPRFFIFVGGGFNLVGFGYNVGAAYKFNPQNQCRVYYTLMYGYNSVIKVENASQFDKTYYGVSTGAGLEIHLKHNSNRFFNFELLIPIRSAEYRNDIDDLKHNPNIEFLNDEIPLAFSFGYHFPVN